MIPYSVWGSCQRMYYLANYLQTNDYNVFLIHYKGDYYGDFEKKILFHSNAIDCKFISSLKSKRSSMEYKEARYAKSHQKFTNSFKYYVKLPIHFIEKKFFNELPGNVIFGKFFIKDALKDIIYTINFNNIHKVIISGPPFALFGLVKMLKDRCSGIKVILDYRDPWNLWGGGSFISLRKEQTCLDLADKVVFVNDKLMKDTIDTFHINKEKCETIFNGFSGQSWEDVIKKNKKFNLGEKRELVISYVGSLSFERNGYRNLTNFFDAINEYRYKDDIRLRLIGISNIKKLKEITNRYNIHIDIVPQVCPEKSLEYMLQSDVLFLIHTDENSSKYILTGKLFDYIRSGKPILGVGYDDAYFIKFIKNHNLGITTTNNVYSIQSALEFIHNSWKNGSIEELRKPSGNEFVLKFSREYQNDKFLNIIKNL